MGTSSGFLCAALLLLPLSSLAFAAVSPRDFHLKLAQRDPGAGFRLFLSRFRKNYTTASEFELRFQIFRKNLQVAIERQIADPSAVHGVTPFSDMTPEEFSKNMLGLKAREVVERSAQSRVAPLLPTADVPDEFDWREKGAVTPVKNQGMCGSCYAFSAVGAVEGAHFLKTGKLQSLSEQQIVDCDHQCDPSYHDACDSGCSGGLMNNVLTYVEGVGGLQLEKEYPYKGKEGKCSFNSSKVAATVQQFVQVPVDEAQITANLVKYGPLAVAINAGWMQSYVKGVSCPLMCDPKALDHGVLLVGYGKHGFSPARLKYKDFWVIKNSWGPGWGEEGYYRVCSGKDECGVDTMVSAVVAVDGDVADASAGLGEMAAKSGRVEVV